jgi:hypothetical protein
MIGNYRYQVRWDALAPEALHRPNKATAVRRSAAPSADDDAALEACEQPVPLAEPAPPPSPPAVGRKAGPANPPKPPPPPGLDVDLPSVAEEEVDQGPRTTAEPHSLVLPEQIELAPVSDIVPTVHNRPPSA